jgi:hypothetical protein
MKVDLANLCRNIRLEFENSHCIIYCVVQHINARQHVQHKVQNYQFFIFSELLMLFVVSETRQKSLFSLALLQNSRKQYSLPTFLYNQDFKIKILVIFI